MLASAETALVQALAAHPHIAKRTRGAGTLPKGSPEEMLRKYAADAPALYVMPGTFVVQSDAAVMRFVVAGVVRNVAGHAQARNGDGIDIGCDHLMTWVAQALHGQNLGGANWSLTRGEMADDEMFDQIGVAAIELHFESSPVLLDLDVDPDGLDDFEHFHGDMDHQPFAGPAEHAKWLQEPPDHSTTQPDAQLDVSLPGPTESTTDA